jgi:hypothetical protein
MSKGTASKWQGGVDISLMKSMYTICRDTTGVTIASIQSTGLLVPKWDPGSGFRGITTSGSGWTEDGGNQVMVLMDYFNINSLGNAINYIGAFYGNSSNGQPGTFEGVTSNGVNDRGITTYYEKINYFTISTTGTVTDFGNQSVSKYGRGTTSNGTNERAIFCGGYSNTYTSDITYCTISTTGNSSSFGNLNQTQIIAGTASNDTNERAVTAGGRTTGGGTLKVIDFVTISTTGNATYFGDMTLARRNGPGCESNGINDRAFFAGGWAGYHTDVIDYVTISTTGNAKNFGNLTKDDGFGMASSSNKTRERATIAGGTTWPDWNNWDSIDYVTINSLSNSKSFGNLTVARGRTAGCSNA